MLERVYKNKRSISRCCFEGWLHLRPLHCLILNGKVNRKESDESIDSVSLPLFDFEHVGTKYSSDA